MVRFDDLVYGRSVATILRRLYPDRIGGLDVDVGALLAAVALSITLQRRGPKRPLRWTWFSSPGYRHYFVGALLVVGIVLDTVTTSVLLGSARVKEGNALIRVAYRYAGAVGILGVKVAILTLGVAVFRIPFGRPRAERMMFWFYIATGAGWLLGGVWNAVLGSLLTVY